MKVLTVMLILSIPALNIGIHAAIKNTTILAEGSFSGSFFFIWLSSIFIIVRYISFLPVGSIHLWHYTFTSNSVYGEPSQSLAAAFLGSCVSMKS